MDVLYFYNINTFYITPLIIFRVKVVTDKEFHVSKQTMIRWDSLDK